MKWYEIAIPIGGIFVLWKAIQTARGEAEPPITNMSLPPTGVLAQEDAVNEQMLHFDAIIRSASGAYNVPENYIRAIIQVESSGNPFATGRSGEIGLMQLMPSTAEWLGYTGPLGDLYLPQHNIKYGTKYLGYWLEKGYSEAEMAAAYNAGDARRYDTGQFKNQRYVNKFFSALDMI